MLFKRFRQARAQAERIAKASEGALAFETAWKALVLRVSKLEAALRDLEEQHSTTVSHLNKLRGQVHGSRGARGALASVSEIPIGDKDALRRAAGITHGQRFNHPEEK